MYKKNTTQQMEYWQLSGTKWPEWLGRLEKVGALPPDAQRPEHAAFGFLTRALWGAFGYKHVNHHFKQFGGVAGTVPQG